MVVTLLSVRENHHPTFLTIRPSVTLIPDARSPLHAPPQEGVLMGFIDDTKENISEGFEKAKDAVGDAAETVKDKAGITAEAVKEKAADAAEFVKDKADDVSEFVKDKLDGDDDTTTPPATPAATA